MKYIWASVLLLSSVALALCSCLYHGWIIEDSILIYIAQCLLFAASCFITDVTILETFKTAFSKK